MPIGSRGTILLLCSDSDVLAVLQGALEEDGYVVRPAVDLGSAVDRLDECRVDLLVVRPYLGEISGHDAALYLRTRCNGLRVLMVAGMPNDDRVVNREALRGVEIFPAPFALSEFVGKVAAMLSDVRRQQSPE